MSIQLHAGCCVGECYPSGLVIADVFGSDDRAAGVYLAELYADRDTSVELIDTNDVDEGCSGRIDEDDLSEDEYQRLDALRAIRWGHFTNHHAYVAGFKLAVGVGERDGKQVAVGFIDGKQRLVADDMPQARVLLALAAFTDREAIIAAPMVTA